MIVDKIYSLNCKPPDNLLPWLSYTKMLTKKLNDRSCDIKLVVLQSCIKQTKWWDRYVLEISTDEVFNREIMVLAYDVPCWYARTIIPIKTYNQHQKLFKKLGSKSLGELIFGDNNIERTSLRYYCVSKDNIEYHWLASSICSEIPSFWVRLSEFAVLHDKFYLAEIFLPELEKYI